MDKKSKTLFIVMFALIILSVFVTYYRYVILVDFDVVNTLEEI